MLKKLKKLLLLTVGLVAMVTVANGKELTKPNSVPIETSITLPWGLPKHFSTTLCIADQHWTLKLEKHVVFGERTRFLVDRGDGVPAEIARDKDRSYLGNVLEHPDYIVSAQLTKTGLMAIVFRLGKPLISIEPTKSATMPSAHLVRFGEQTEANHAISIQNSKVASVSLPKTAALTEAAAAGVEINESVKPIATVEKAAPSTHEVKSRATLPPDRVMKVYEFEVGVEIGSRSFLAKSAHNGNLEKAKAVVAGIATNLDARYLRGAGIKHTVGTVIIRTDPETDPLREEVTTTGAGGGAGKSLAAFRKYWNSHPEEVGTTHDLAVYHVYYPPSGLAYVNSVGSDDRYATTGGRGATSWANGTLVHEFGHSWNLRHVRQSGIFYESKPRNKSGSHQAGGSDTFVSVMHGGSVHNIGRLATDEANIVYAARNAKRHYGKLYEPGPTPPFGHRDEAILEEDRLVIDVAANDYDVNNDPLDVRLLDTVSQQGGTISLSAGTGPGGRNEIIYTPPTTFIGKDFFHYTVFDGSGRSDWGAVYITSSRISIDLDQDSYAYDFGTVDSPVFSSKEVQAVRITPDTTGDITWSRPVKSTDRPKSRQNAYNRDLVSATRPVVWSHKIRNGSWNVKINMSDPGTDLVNMYIQAEGKLGLSGINHPKGKNETLLFDVEVKDGELNLEFGATGEGAQQWALNRVVLTRKKSEP